MNLTATPRPVHLDLVHGAYDRKQAIDLLTRFVHAQITAIERSIGRDSTEEDIAHSERRIAQLQEDFFVLKSSVLAGGDRVTLRVRIDVQPS